MTVMVYNVFMFIYRITNTVNNKVYIGLSAMKNRPNGLPRPEKERFWQHLANARNTTRRNKFLDAIRKYGEDVWFFEIIDRAATLEELNELEIKYIQEYDSIKSGYNTASGGDFSFHTEETKQKMRDNHPRGMKGKTHTAKHRSKLSEVHSKKYVVTTPIGEEVEVFNLTKFCKENNLTPQVMYSVANKAYGQKSHKGYTVVHS